MAGQIKLKSAYEPSEPGDGSRYLVETFWPEGVEAYDLIPCAWARELAPSYFMRETALRQHWPRERFRKAYEQELREPERRDRFMEVVKEARSGIVTLLYNSRKKDWLIGPSDTSAYDLREFLEAELNKDSGTERSCAVVYPDFIPPRRSEDGGNLERWANEGGR